MIKEIRLGKKLLALHVHIASADDGTHPVTDPKYALQMLAMKRKKGHVFAKHTHKIISRTVPTMQEAIVVTKGVLKVTVCDREGNEAKEFSLGSGECLFVVEGGFKIEVAEDTLFYEFKNGPHEDDKILL